MRRDLAMHEFWRWLFMGFAFGVGFTLAQLALTGLLSILGRGRSGP